MSRLTFFGSIAAAACILPLAPSVVRAQSADDADISTITVIAPHAEKTGRSSSTGAPIVTMTAQAVVYFDDLDLKTSAGQDQLRARVAAAAKASCDQLNIAFPISPTATPSPADCPGDAVRRAQAQVDRAVTAAQ